MCDASSDFAHNCVSKFWPGPFFGYLANYQPSRGLVLATQLLFAPVMPGYGPACVHVLFVPCGLTDGSSCAALLLNSLLEFRFALSTTPYTTDVSPLKLCSLTLAGTSLVGWPDRLARVKVLEKLFQCEFVLLRLESYRTEPVVLINPTAEFVQRYPQS